MHVTRHLKNSRMPAFYPNKAESMVTTWSFVDELTLLVLCRSNILKHKDNIENATTNNDDPIRVLLITVVPIPHHGRARTKHVAVTVLPVQHSSLLECL